MEEIEYSNEHKGEHSDKAGDNKGSNIQTEADHNKISAKDSENDNNKEEHSNKTDENKNDIDKSQQKDSCIIDYNKEQSDNDFKEQDENKKCCSCKCASIYTMFGVFAFEIIVLSYIGGVGTLNIVFYPQVYRWVSLFTKEKAVDVVFTVIGIFSDFGVTYLLFVIVYSTVNGFVDQIKKQLKMFKQIFVVDEDENESKLSCIIIYEVSYIIAYTIMIVLSLVYEEGLFYIIVISYPFYFFIVALINISSFVYALKRDKAKMSQVYQYAVTNLSDRSLENKEKCNSKAFIFPTVLFVLVGQFYLIVVSGMSYGDTNSTGKVGIVTGIIIKILLITKAIDFNIFDTIFNYKRTWYVITDKWKEEKNNENEEKYNEKALHSDSIPSAVIKGFEQGMDKGMDIVQKAQDEAGDESKLFSWIVALGLLIGGSIFAIVLGIYAAVKDMPYVDDLKFIQEPDEWRKLNGNISSPLPNFCKISPDLTDSISTADISMLTTLPRLYKINGDKCFIKPKLRGVFNSTMKYIFGADYEHDNITIMCYPKSHNPYLVITSEKYEKEALDKYEETNITILQKTPFVKSNNFFDKLDPLGDGRAKTELDILSACLSKNEECLDEWDNYTNKYWKSFDIDSNEELPGFEQYQIVINDDTVFEPSFITSDGRKISGTHFVVGGGFEDAQGYGFLVENIARVYLPYVLENFIPLYSWANSYFRISFNKVSVFAYHFFYVESIGNDEIRILTNLLSQFNFSSESIFMVGQSISGSAFKEISYISDIKGIAFESSNGRGIASSVASEKFTQVNERTNKVANIYSDEMLLSGQDPDFGIEGMLPNHFYNPNVYDTACQVIVSCSNTKKYIPFCQQVLTQGGNDPIKEFQAIIDSYYKDNH